MGVIRRYPEARPGLERHPLSCRSVPSGVAQQVMGVEQGVGDFRALLQPPRRMAAGIASAGLCGRASGYLQRMRMPRTPQPRFLKAGAIRRRTPSCRSSMRCSRCSRSSVPQGFQRAARRCSSWRVRRRMRRSAPASRRSRSQTQAPGGQGWRRGGKRSWHHHSQDRRPAATLRRPRERASALQRHLPCRSRPLRMA